MKRVIILFFITSVLDLQGMDTNLEYDFLEEDEHVEQKYDTYDEELSSNNGFVAFFYCHICNMNIHQKPGVDVNYNEHLIEIHRTCGECLARYNNRVIYKSTDLVRNHIKEKHPNPVPRLIKAVDKIIISK